LFSNWQSLHHRATQFFHRSKAFVDRARQPVRQVARVIIGCVQRSFSDDFCDGHAALSPHHGAVTSDACRVQGVAAMQRSGIEAFVGR